MRAALVLIITAALLGMPTAIIAYNNPRRAGEPPGAQRKALLGLGALGMDCVLVGAAMFFTAERGMRESAGRGPDGFSKGSLGGHLVVDSQQMLRKSIDRA